MAEHQVRNPRGLRAAAVLTSSPDAWNQIVFAAPMLGLYLLSIAVAWFVQPKEKDTEPPAREAGLRLVFAATMLEQARRSATRPHAGWIGRIVN